MADVCPYCRGGKTLDSAIDGRVACRVCLGTGKGIYENDLGHDARPRELRRIAELLDLLGPEYHIFESTSTRGWSVEHPVECKPDLLACPIQQACVDLEAPPVPTGRYRTWLDDDGELMFDELTDG